MVWIFVMKMRPEPGMIWLTTLSWTWKIRWSSSGSRKRILQKLRRKGRCARSWKREFWAWGRRDWPPFLVLNSPSAFGIILEHSTRPMKMILSWTAMYHRCSFQWARSCLENHKQSHKKHIALAALKEVRDRVLGVVQLRHSISLLQPESHWIESHF